MAKFLDLQSLVQIIGPHVAEGLAERDAQFHPLAAKRQHRFTGRIALGLDQIGEEA